MSLEQFEAELEAARAGDEGAWQTLFRAFAPPVLGYFRANRAPEPEDCLSETFLQVARDLPRFSGGETQFRSWVFTIAHHRLIDAKRGAARRPSDPVADVPEPPPDEGTDAAEEALAQIGAEEVRELLDSISPDQRAVLLLRIIGDQTFAEVAKTMGKRQGAVKALQRRGLAAVRQELARRGVTL
jgi:RNA polymerase sigma factor (sigma-70 family)